MEFCIISPTAGLERYARLSTWHLVLTQICHRDINYEAFYYARKQAGDFLILDNGAYEDGVPSLDFDLIRHLEPNVVVLPDYPLQPWKKTWHAAIHYLDINSHDAQDFEWLYIPQAEKGDIHGFLESYQEAASDHRITWIGIPRSLALAVSSNPLARVEFARMVRKDNPRLKLHAFGMVNGDIHELPYLAHAGVNSIDSSAPVWRGWNRHPIHLREEWDKFGTAVDFNADAPDEVADHFIMDNLEACGVRISTGQRTTVQGQDVEDSQGLDDGSISF